MLKSFLVNLSIFVSIFVTASVRIGCSLMMTYVNFTDLCSVWKCFDLMAHFSCWWKTNKSHCPLSCLFQKKLCC